VGDVVERVGVVFVVLVVRGLGCVVRRLDACPVRSPPACLACPPDRLALAGTRPLAAAPHGAPASAGAGEAGGGVGCDRSPGRGGRCAPSRRPRGELIGRGGGQIRGSSLLVVRVACHQPGRTTSPSSVQSRALAGRSPAIAGVRSAVPAPGPGTPCPGRRGATRSSRRYPLPRLGRAVCLPSAASSAPTQRSGQALRFASRRES
jgi:hypothetical protein